MDPLVQVTAESLDGVSFNEKWELLKPELKRLYLEDKLKLTEIMQIMKARYRFDADEAQYKYRFGRKWGWKKYIPSSKMVAICAHVKSRATLGKKTKATYKEIDVDSRRIRRHMKEEKRKEEARKQIAFTSRGAFGPGTRESGFAGFVLPFPGCIFLNWNLPYTALRSSISRDLDQPSPLGPFGPTPPSDSSVNFASPEHAETSPQNAPSPLSVALKKDTAIDRARFFIQGKYDHLYKSLDRSERATTSTWLYQFWLFAFKTAKYWGRGPRHWTAGRLDFSTYEGFRPLQNAPGMLASSPGDAASSQSLVREPSPLCRWSIHRPEDVYDAIPSPPPEQNSYDSDEEGLSTEWCESWRNPPLEERLMNGLAASDFSSLNSKQIPLAISHVARAAERSPNDLLVEALGFSIISRNLDLVEDSLRKVFRANADVSQLFPLHLATSYLDGSTQCCNILSLLCNSMAGRGLLKQLEVNNLGHTVLDNLMITILKAHTSVSPGIVDEALKRETRFTGEEVDICGRWDADSDCYRSLLASGRSLVPSEWKHPFCHTSVQAVCHSILSLNEVIRLSDLSGLFLRRCSHCGLKLQLRPLHTLVLIAFYLGQYGRENESLFGILACLLCLLSVGVDPSARVPISLAALLDEDVTDDCSHELMRPVDLAQKVPAAIIDRWSNESKTGWRVFCRVLDIACHDWRFDLEESEYGTESMDEGHSSSDIDSMIDIDETELGAQTWGGDTPNKNYGENDGQGIVNSMAFAERTVSARDGSSSLNVGNIGYGGYGGDFRDIELPPSVFAMHSPDGDHVRDNGDHAANSKGNTETDKSSIQVDKDNGDRRTAAPRFSESCDAHLSEGVPGVFRKRSCLGHIWAAIRTELLTYRRLGPEDTWNSENFDMHELLKSLEAGGTISIGLVGKGMMKPYCNCGVFGGFYHPNVRREDVADEYFSNLDDWNRTTFIEVTGERDLFGGHGGYLLDICILVRRSLTVVETP
ncbi:MAG: hypothetical protein M1839_009274 [Geoglossum umbratile]|nr:MAG: hypothetical protein M1839_009274 [Geoglossum umbratile]